MRPTIFESTCTYQDLHEYKVYGGASQAVRVEVYRAPHPSTLAYMRETFNHCGDPTAFDRMITARQHHPEGGAIARTNVDSRWTPELYREFCAHLEAKHAEYEKRHARQVEKYGADYPAMEPMKPHPLPIFWDDAAGTYSVEPFYLCAFCVGLKETGHGCIDHDLTWDKVPT